MAPGKQFVAGCKVQALVTALCKSQSVFGKKVTREKYGPDRKIATVQGIVNGPPSLPTLAKCGSIGPMQQRA